MGHLQTTFVLLLLGCLLVNIAKCATTIDDEPKDVVLKDAETLAVSLMECKTAANAIMDWQRDSTGKYEPVCKAESGKEGVPTCSDKKFEIDTKLYNLNLVTPKTVDFTLAGNYQCTVDGVAKPKVGSLTVVGAPICSKTPVYVPKGKDSEISCSIKYKGTKPTIKITGTGLTKSDTSDGVEAAGVLEVIATGTINTNQGATYTCTASVAVTPEYKDPCTLTVEVYDEVISKKPQGPYIAKVGDEAVIPCTVKNAAVYEEVNWFKDDVLICTGTATPATCTDEKYELNTTMKHNLKVKEVKYASAGVYKCKVKVSDTINVEEHKAELVVVQDKANCTKGELKEGKRDLTCAINYKGSSKPTLTWSEPTDYKVDRYRVSTQADDTWTLETKIETGALPTKKYVCTVTDGPDLGCDVDVDSGASVLNAKFFQATLLSLAVLFVMNRFR